jgi:HSP20 family protein
VYFDLPGIDPSSVDLSLERNRLTLKVTRSWELAEGEQAVVRERPSGDFTRTLTLSEGLDSTRITARYEHGVLIVTIPVAELAQPRKIVIGSAEAAAVVDAHASTDNGSAGTTNGTTVGAGAGH